MTTLTTLAPLLDRLFTESAALDPMAVPAIASTSPADRERLLRSKTGYLDLYSALKDMPLPVSRETGTLLYMLARGSRAKAIVEFGTSFGISTLHLAAALRDNGGGRLITSEFEPSKIARARQHLAEARLADLVEVREGDALQTLRTDLPVAIDLVLLDGAKGLYADVLALLEDRLYPGSLVIADNADMCPDYIARVRSPRHGYLSVPVGEEVELSMRIYSPSAL